MTPAEIRKMMEDNKLVGTCPCGWVTEYRTIGETQKVIRCPTCGRNLLVTKP